MITDVEYTGYLTHLANEWIASYSGSFVSTATLIDELLAFQTSLYPIIRGDVSEQSGTISISFTNCSILAALTQLQTIYAPGHMEVDNNRQLNWYRLSAHNYAGQQIRYKKNLVGISRSIDYSQLANKIYAYGAGTWGSRVHLSSAPGYALDYVYDATSQATWGVITKTIWDNNQTSAQLLKGWADSELAKRKDPIYTYKINMVDLSKETGFEFNTLNLLEPYQVIDEELGISVETRITRINRRDLSNPYDVDVELSNNVVNISDTIAELARRK